MLPLFICKFSFGSWVFLYLLNNIYFDLFTFNVNLFANNHKCTLFNSLFKTCSLFTLSISSRQQFKAVSSASVAYPGFYFGGGGGVQNVFRKVGVFAWRFAPCSARRNHAFVRGFGGMLPEKFFKNGAIWCVLENILLKFCKIKIIKNSHF